jgi:hypothetical protein
MGLGDEHGQLCAIAVLGEQPRQLNKLRHAARGPFVQITVLMMVKTAAIDVIFRQIQLSEAAEGDQRPDASAVELHVHLAAQIQAFQL